MRIATNGYATVSALLHQVLVCWKSAGDFGFKQMVREPTRKSRLLNLVLANIQELVRTSVLDALSDHSSVLVEVHVEITCVQCPPRLVWDYKRADWNSSRSMIASHQ